MEQLNNLDVVFLIIVGISALVGIVRGMTKEILSILGWILAAASVVYLVPVFEPITQKYIASKLMSNIVTGLAILIIFSIVWILMVDKIATEIRLSKLSMIDRMLGFVFGAARGVLIVILVALMISTLIPEESKKGIFAESQYFQVARESAEPLKDLIPQSLIDDLKAKGESLGLAVNKDNKDDKEVNNQSTTADDDKKTTAKSDEQQKEDKNSSDGDNKPSVVKTIDGNLDILQKSGEELFNQLAQPKTAGISEESLDELSSDLDMLLDVLEDKVIITDEAAVPLKSESQNITDKVSKKAKNQPAK